MKNRNITIIIPFLFLACCAFFGKQIEHQMPHLPDSDKCKCSIVILFLAELQKSSRARAKDWSWSKCPDFIVPWKKREKIW